MLGIPCGFAIFPDGVAWADDGVLADYASHHPRHHLFGPVSTKDGNIVCDGCVFSPASLGHPEFGPAWDSLNLNREGWLSVHRTQEPKLREERARFAET
jgi:hypothetical protein